MRVAFLGTPDFALPSLEMLIRRGHTLSVFTQPDKPVGRRAVMTPPPVKTLALAHGIPVFQCEKSACRMAWRRFVHLPRI